MSDEMGPMSYPTGRILRAADQMLSLSLPQWEAAMHACFHFEVMVRILAQKHFLGESITRDIGDNNKKGEGLLTMLFRTLAFTDDEKQFLRRCNTFGTS
jgi:hypothetical protein